MLLKDVGLLFDDDAFKPPGMLRCRGHGAGRRRGHAHGWYSPPLSATKLGSVPYNAKVHDGWAAIISQEDQTEVPRPHTQALMLASSGLRGNCTWPLDHGRWQWQVRSVCTQRPA